MVTSRKIICSIQPYIQMKVLLKIKVLYFFWLEALEVKGEESVSVNSGSYFPLKVLPSRTVLSSRNIR